MLFFCYMIYMLEIADAAPIIPEIIQNAIPQAEQTIPAIAIPGFLPVSGFGFCMHPRTIPTIPRIIPKIVQQHAKRMLKIPNTRDAIAIP